MAKIPPPEEGSGGLPFYNIDRHGNPLATPGRSPDDPPPYSEVDDAILPVTVSTQNPGSRRTFVSKAAHVLRSRGAAPSDTADPSVPIVTRGVALASKSIDVVCPHCQTTIRTSIEKRPGLLAYLSGAVMACLCCFCGCCLIPCCIDECMEVKHTCPNCDGLIGKYRL